MDLDGTLIKSDVLLESILALLRASPARIISLLAWLFQGRAYVKSALAEKVTLDPADLPYNDDVVNFVRTEFESGREVVLCTATHQTYANQIAEHLGIFSSVMGTDETVNLKGANKARALCDRYGEKQFDYVGDSAADVPVWQAARKAIVVGSSERQIQKLAERGEDHEVIDSPPAKQKDFMRALRPHQWAKNALLFVPLLAAHELDASLLLQNLLAFVAFSFAASSTYLVNDLLDLPSDRRHPTKSNRPFAAGSIPLTFGVVAVPVLTLISLVIGLLLPASFFGLLMLYYVITLSYSFALKRMVLLDVLTLASLYTLRIIAGSAATAIVPSFWLLAFAVFLFLSLALAKRTAELLVMKQAGEKEAAGRGYLVADLPIMMMLGTTSGLIGVLVMALYVNSDIVSGQYAMPQLIWFLCPLLLFWILRLWFITNRGELHEDPVVYALTNRTSLLVGALCVLVVLFAI